MSDELSSEWFFGSAERQAALVVAARTWLGTPFRARTAVKGAGVDCVHLLAAIYTACCVPHDFKPPAYSLDWSQHQERSLLVEYLLCEPCLAELTQSLFTIHDSPGEGGLLPGDILVFKIGRCEHHAGMVVQSWRFIHAVARSGATMGSLRDKTWRKRWTRTFRAKGGA